MSNFAAEFCGQYFGILDVFRGDYTFFCKTVENMKFTGNAVCRHKRYEKVLTQWYDTYWSLETSAPVENK